MFRKTILLLSFLGLSLPFFYVSAGTILVPHIYAWSSNVGYINFERVIVHDNALSGYAWSTNVGWINFSPAKGGVINDGTGNLSGSAWGEQLGWIDFDNVSINPTTGEFSGTATGTLAGTITFDCPHYCDVQTDWREAPPATTSSSGGSSPVNSGASSDIFPPATNPNSVNSVPIESNNALVPPSISTPVFNPGAPKNISSTGKNINIASSNNASGTPALFDVVLEPIQVKVAPGEFLPMPVKLSNFGAGKRVDVRMTYSILADSGKEIYSTNETVAVETTANFVRTIQIPFDTAPGAYRARISITYQGQLTAAVAEFPFTVERKIVGLFQSDFIVYGSTTLSLSILLSLLAYALIKRHRAMRLAPLDYSHIPRDKRTFYEILSDTITQMRLRVGDKAITIAAHIDGLKINKETGRVLEITGPPAKIIAELVSEYEKLLGKKVSFSFRESGNHEGEKL